MDAGAASWVLSGDQLDAWIKTVERSWGTGETVRFWIPSKANDESFRRGWARWERQGGSPSMAIALTRMNQDVDIRHILPAVRVPTLLLHRVGDTRVDIAAGRYLATRIPNARLVELPGVDHVPFDITDRIIDEVEEFLTGSRRDVEPDRVLATALFTDIVDFTKRASALGDRAWRQLLDRHDAAAREEIAHFRGRPVKHLGDGFLATFDGPARGVRCAAQSRPACVRSE